MRRAFQMIGQTLGHYRVVEKLGAGGMGEVYRAHDERLQRDVALKVLPPGTLADEIARKRFRKEALTLSKLDHPNLASVYDFDTQDGVDFLVMGLVPGRTLDEVLRAGPLPEREALRLGVQVAQGLAAAHDQGVIHRDLKPANVRLTPDGRLKILDFGLATLRQRDSDAMATTGSLSQAVAGTPPYMAPEHIRGDRADARSDVYAAGAVLYEMATGRRPFQETGALLIDAILNQEPEPPSAVQRQVSSGLEFVILKALEKQPERRYQTARDLLVDLERLNVPSTVSTLRPAAGWRWPKIAAYVGLAALAAGVLTLRLPASRGRAVGAAVPGRIESLAVLPLQNLSGVEEEYFADGMTEALITDLSKIGALKVISRTSSMQYRGAKKGVPQIARELGVDAVVEGAVMRSGDQVRITAQLIEAAADRHLWAESYERPLRDVLALQADVARAIAGEIRIRVAPSERERLAASPAVDAEVHELYLKGRYFSNKRTRQGLEKGIEYFDRAIEKAPGFARAHAAKALSYSRLSSYALHPREAMPKAKSEAMKALALDEGLSEAHTALGCVSLFYDWDPAAAEKHLRRGIELDPSSADDHVFLSQYLSAAGRHEEALAEARRALEIDPLSPSRRADVQWALLLARRYTPAIEEGRRALEMDPSLADAHALLGLAYAETGDLDRAVGELQAAARLDDSPVFALFLAHGYAVAGKRREAEQVLAEVRETSKRRYVCSYEVATAYSSLGDDRRAFEWFRRAVGERSDCLVWLTAEPWLDRIRRDPEFANLVAAVGFDPTRTTPAAGPSPPSLLPPTPAPPGPAR